MTDEKGFRIDRPEFVFASPNETTQVIIENQDGSEVWLPALHITAVTKIGATDAN